MDFRSPFFLLLSMAVKTRKCNIFLVAKHIFYVAKKYTGFFHMLFFHLQTTLLRLSCVTGWVCAACPTVIGYFIATRPKALPSSLCTLWAAAHSIIHENWIILESFSRDCKQTFTHEPEWFIQNVRDKLTWSPFAPSLSYSNFEYAKGALGIDSNSTSSFLHFPCCGRSRSLGVEKKCWNLEKCFFKKVRTQFLAGCVILSVVI